MENRISDLDGKLMDVRRPTEYEAEHLEDALSRPLDYIHDNIDTLDKDETYYIYCAGGYRSVIESSILRSHGFKNIINILGGFEDLKKTDIPKTDFVCSRIYKPNQLVMLTRVVVLFPLLFVFLFSCAQEKKESSETINKDISVEEFQSMYDPDKHVILDVRTKEEWDEGHLENTIQIDYYGDDFKEQLAQLDKSKTYMVHCKKGGRSSKANSMMADMGFQETYNIMGGYLEMEAKGIKIVKD